MLGNKLTRRRWLQMTTATAVAGLLETKSFPEARAGAALDRIAEVRLATIFRGRLGDDGKPLGPTWFSTRCCMAPSSTPNTPPLAVMLMCEIRGSDYFEPTHETVSRDLGRTWSEPTPVPGMGRVPLGDDMGTAVGVCDMVPEFHAKTGTVLAMGHDVFYRDKRFFAEQPPRHTVYAVRRPDGIWSPLERLAWDDPRGKFIYTCNCAQRITLADGDVLVPLSVGATSAARGVVVVRCGFDGKRIEVRRTSNELQHKAGRGLLEPSLAEFKGRYFLTLRAEDSKGYVSASEDGLTWSPHIAWQFDDGTPIAMSSTQQRWLVGRDALYLVYTRRDPTNENVMRWRAPLFAARVDVKTLRLVRETERVVVPLTGDGVKDGANVPHLGNFHVNQATDGESWVTVGDYSARTFRGDVTLARVMWSRG